MSTSYRYFEHPYRFSTYREESGCCDICGREVAGYNGPFYGTRDVEFVCEDCLAAGRLQDFDVTTNEGDVGALREQLQQSHPELGDSDLERLSDERRAELEYRTPHMVTWQDFFWPAHCGDYCRVIKEVGRPELTQLSPEGDGTAFFAAHAHDVADLDHARSLGGHTARYSSRWTCRILGRGVLVPLPDLRRACSPVGLRLALSHC
jgi:uncharacterized protein CbrC (UPF0167 family)